jgi:hypothetical protein
MGIKQSKPGAVLKEVRYLPLSTSYLSIEPSDRPIARRTGDVLYTARATTSLEVVVEILFSDIVPSITLFIESTGVVDCS